LSSKTKVELRDVRYWHKADVRHRPINVRFRGNSGHGPLSGEYRGGQRIAAERGMPELLWLSWRRYLRQNPNPGIPLSPHLWPGRCKPRLPVPLTGSRATVFDYVSHGASFCRSRFYYRRRVDLCSGPDTPALAFSRRFDRANAILETEVNRHDIPSSLSPAPSPNRCCQVWFCVCQMDAQRDCYPDYQRDIVHRLRDIQHDTWMDIDGARAPHCVDSDRRFFSQFRSSWLTVSFVF